MPELPEVEFARRSLVKWFEGHSLVRGEADHAARTFRKANPAAFDALAGHLTSATRRGKYLMLAFSNGQGAVAHLGMTGKFVKVAESAVVPYSRARFVLENGDVIHFRDPRLFGRIEPMPAAKLTSDPVISALGVDPLVDGLTVEQLKQAVSPSKQELKVALMDQSRIAGLGNIHAAEALFRAKLHPARRPDTLTDTEWSALRDGIMASIDFALESTSGLDEIEYVEEPGTKNPFLVYGREKEPCPTCGTPIQFIDQGGRTSYFCPTCQVAPKKVKKAKKLAPKQQKPAAKTAKKKKPPTTTKRAPKAKRAKR